MLVELKFTMPQNYDAGILQQIVEHQITVFLENGSKEDSKGDIIYCYLFKAASGQQIQLWDSNLGHSEFIDLASANTAEHWTLEIFKTHL